MNAELELPVFEQQQVPKITRARARKVELEQKREEERQEERKRQRQRELARELARQLEQKRELERKLEEDRELAWKEERERNRLAQEKLEQEQRARPEYGFAVKLLHDAEILHAAADVVESKRDNHLAYVNQLDDVLEHKRIGIGRAYILTREALEASGPNIGWEHFCKEHSPNRSMRDIRRCMAIAGDDDPGAALAD
jgi:hypothetical protein